MVELSCSQMISLTWKGTHKFVFLWASEKVKELFSLSNIFRFIYSRASFHQLSIPHVPFICALARKYCIVIIRFTTYRTAISTNKLVIVENRLYYSKVIGLSTQIRITVVELLRWSLLTEITILRNTWMWKVGGCSLSIVGVVLVASFFNFS